MVYDFEILFAEIESFLKANLNVKIAALNAEKGDSLLDLIDNEAYAFQSMDSYPDNYDEFVFYGLKDIIATGKGPVTIKNFVLFVIICVTRDANDVNPAKKMLRYGRVLKEIFEDNFDSATRGAIRFEVQSLVPEYYQELNSTNGMDVVGVNINGAFA